MRYSGMTGILPPPPGASTTKVGTAKPLVCPRRASMISIPLETGVPEVLQAHAQVALINVIRSHSYFDQLVNQPFHDVNAVVDACKQHALVSERYTRVSKHFAGAT